VFDFPIASDSSGTLYFHENGNDDNGAEMGEFIESSPFDLDDGNRVLRIKSIVPDFKMSGGVVKLFLKTRLHPNGVLTTSEELLITSATERVFLRQVGRQVALRIEGTDIGHEWRLGKPRFDIERGGTR
jgi:hypothetical protein